jgi:cyclopropane fatty-acyl-phospholipid synthase-like methyltransferase
VSKHWNDVYEHRRLDELSWTEDEPTTSLELLDVLGVGATDSVLDVGAGRSTLVARLHSRGLEDLTILDLSASALADVRSRPGLEHLTTVEADVTTWRPTRRFDVWHDRAVLHFVEPRLVVRYFDTLRASLSARGSVVIGVFAPDGPTSCSGLTVTRYDAHDLTRLLGDEFDVVATRRVRHLTPWGAPQSFQWVAARRRRASSPLAASRRSD